jgi:hypothetical protein
VRCCLSGAHDSSPSARVTYWPASSRYSAFVSAVGASSERRKHSSARPRYFFALFSGSDTINPQLSPCNRGIYAEHGTVHARLARPAILRTKKEHVKCHSMALIDLNERDVDKWTLHLVVERGTLVFECRNCRHLSEIDVLEMIARFGTDAQVSSVRARMVCRQCHKRRVRSLVKLKVGRKDLAWVPVPPRAGR